MRLDSCNSSLQGAGEPCGPGIQAKRGRVGFTLVELLLSVAIVLLLVGAVVFSFSSLMKGSQLDEGVDQFENLIRLARAEAANNGRRVQMIFQEEVTAESSVVGKVTVQWEPDPLGKPGQLETLWPVTPVVNNVNEMIAIDSTRRSGIGEATLSAGESEVQWTAGGAEAPPWLVPVTFYADGSSNSAEIRLVSRNGEDSRRIVLHLEGITGSLRREILAAEQAAATGKSAPAEEAR